MSNLQKVPEMGQAHNPTLKASSLNPPQTLLDPKPLKLIRLGSRFLLDEGTLLHKSVINCQGMALGILWVNSPLHSGWKPLDSKD